MVSENTKKYLIKLYDEHNILLEGNILKVIIKEVRNNKTSTETKY
jgi:hypothetical protein